MRGNASIHLRLCVVMHYMILSLLIVMHYIGGLFMLEELFQLSRVYLREHQFSHRRSDFQSNGFLSHRLSILAGPREV